MKILILGGAGMLGHQMYLKLSQQLPKAQVAITLRKPKSHYNQFGLFKEAQAFEGVDVLNFSETQKILEGFKPDFIVNCIGLTLRKKELADIEKCFFVNGMLPHLLAKWGLTNHARVIHFSTDCVFDGKKGNYLESDLPTAFDPYGQSKFLGEIQYKNSLTLRLSIVGRELEGKTELIEWFLSQKGKSIKGFSKAMYSGLTTNYVANEVGRIIKNFPDLSGLFHVSSQPISKWELLKIVNRVYQTQTAIEENPDYISDKILNSEKYQKATGYEIPRWQDLIQEMKNEEQVKYDQF